MRICENCPKRLPAWRRAGTRFCSGRCRVSSHRAGKKLPTDLRHRDNWVRHDERKRPLGVCGQLARVNESRAWVSHQRAVASTVGVGVGFVLDGSGIGVIDLDDAITDDGHLTPWAAEILAANRGTYVELSRSGRGLHIWGYLDHQPGRRIRDGRNIEIYSTGRYIAMGKPYRGSGSKLKPLRTPA